MSSDSEMQMPEMPEIEPPKRRRRKRDPSGVKFLLLLIVSVIGGFIYWKYFSPKEEVTFTVKMPANLYDASQTCLDKMQEHFGERLLRHYIDERSSRAEDERFKVFYIADVGSHTAFNELTIYCYIEKDEMNLSYFRDYGREVEGVQAKSVDLF